MMPLRHPKAVFILLILAVMLLLPPALSAQTLSDGRINVVHHFGGDAFYCVDRDNNPTGQYADASFGGMRLLNSSGNELWFLPAADIATAVEAAQTSGEGVLVGSGQGTYGPVWLYTYIDATGNVKFVFTGHDEYAKINSMAFTYCQQIGPGGSAPSGSDEPACPPDSSPDGDGGPVPDSDCYCDDPEASWLDTQLGWMCGIAVASDVHLKQGFASVDVQRILEQVAALPLSEWSYRTETGVRHVGPMAQDFMAAFGLGDDPTRISVVDANGINLAATQGLYQLAQAQQAQLEVLETRNQTTLLLAVAAVVMAGATGALTLFRRRR